MNIKLIGHNTEIENMDKDKESTPETISATYARISRSPDIISDIRKNALQDVDNVRKSNYSIIFKLGHGSVAEHAYFNFDLIDVSRAFLEDLERHRLASYTERSQRYINFSNSSFYIPEVENKEEIKEYYDECMRTYNELVSLGVPEEDARYFLPLAVHSQAGFSCNARELEYILTCLKASQLKESRDIADEMLKQLNEKAPSLFKYTDIKENNSINKRDHLEVSFMEMESDLLVSHSDFDYFLYKYYKMGEQAEVWKRKGFSDPKDKKKYRESFQKEINSYEKRDPLPRYLEFFNFDIEIDLSAAAYAQMKRHRMMSILISPYFVNIKPIMPNSIKKINYDYKPLYNKMKEMIKKNEELAIYFILGFVRRKINCRINLREMIKFIRLRSDEHAQEEIRKYSDVFKELLREELGIIL